MPTYTISQSFPTGRQRSWTNPTTQETVVFEMYAVQFNEMPGTQWELSRTKNAKAPFAGQQINGHIETNKAGKAYFKEEKAQSNNNGNGNGQAPQANNGHAGNGARRSYGGGSSTDRAIMAQVALKESVNVTVAAQKFDPAYTDGLATAYMETMLRLAKLKVDEPAEQPAPVQPAAPVQAAPQAQFAPSNGSPFQAEELPF